MGWDSRKSTTSAPSSTSALPVPTCATFGATMLPVPTTASFLTQVYCRNEDFYKKLRQGSLPPHDCIITNPPFSGSHIQKLMEHCSSSGKPWLILMPTYVALKDYYKDTVLTGGKRQACPFYLVPRKRCAACTGLLECG